jgi:hypothetical protein
MGAADWLVVGLWLAAIAFMVVMAWEPWRETRRQQSIDLSDEFVGRAVTPRYVFILPAFVAIAPFVAQLVPPTGTVNLWRHPHLLSPAGPLALIVLVAIQAVLCRSVLRAVRRQREAHERTRQTLLSAGRKSVRRPR